MKKILFVLFTLSLFLWACQSKEKMQPQEVRDSYEILLEGVANNPGLVQGHQQYRFVPTAQDGLRTSLDSCEIGDTVDVNVVVNWYRDADCNIYDAQQHPLYFQQFEDCDTAYWPGMMLPILGLYEGDTSSWQMIVGSYLAVSMYWTEPCIYSGGTGCKGRPASWTIWNDDYSIEYLEMSGWPDEKWIAGLGWHSPPPDSTNYTLHPGRGRGCKSMAFEYYCE